MNSTRHLSAHAALFLVGSTLIADDFVPDRCQLMPLPERQVSFQIDGIEKTRWHFDESYPRPFFHPFNGPSGISLTRMGHPGAENHDHHRSVWFAHHDVGGVDFWSDNTGGRVRQKHWYRYRDGNDECVMASLLGWYDGEGKELMEQDVVAALRPRSGGEQELEIQITLRPPTNAETVVLGKTNFGILAVRVSKTLSEHFGGGRLACGEGREGAEAIHEHTARWVDYSGPVVVGTGPDRKVVTEGITFFDHPANPRYPTYWHVRADGWMGASFCHAEGYAITKEAPLVLRYLLHAHAGDYDGENAGAVAASFAKRPGFALGKSDKPHLQFDVWRVGEE